MTTIREQWNALLGRLGLASDTENGVSDKQLETLNEALAEPADTPAEETAAGQTVTATRTLRTKTHPRRKRPVRPTRRPTTAIYAISDDKAGLRKVIFTL